MTLDLIALESVLMIALKLTTIIIVMEETLTLHQVATQDIITEQRQLLLR